MAARGGTSGVMRPWAWLAAFAAVCLVLASSTALYAINSGVRLGLPWWTAVVAPALVYALVLPLCVPRIRLGGWLVGFSALVLLHVLLGLATAWLYAQVGLTSFEEALAPAFWGFPPALVLAMVGSLLMTIPFLGALAPPQAGPRGRPDTVPIAELAPKRIRQEPPPAPVQARQTWARPPEIAVAPVAEPMVPAVVEPHVEPVAEPPVAPVVEPVMEPVLAQAPPPVTAAVAPVIEEPPASVPELATVHAASLSGTNGSVSDVAEPAADAAPDFRQALTELFGAPASRGHGADALETLDDPEVAEPEVEETIVAAAPEPVAPTLTSPPVEPAAPARPEPPAHPTTGMVRIPFERVVGQLPPGAFRVPLAQVGARLREPGTLLVAQALIMPQLGEGVVQVAWEAVSDQFPAPVFAVAPPDVKERIVNGRLLLPLDEIVRQLPPDVFGASMARGTVSVPGIENFPAPFKPGGQTGGPAAIAPPGPARTIEPPPVESEAVVAVAPPIETPPEAPAPAVAARPVEPEPIVIEEVPPLEEVPAAMVDLDAAVAADQPLVVAAVPVIEPVSGAAAIPPPAEPAAEAAIRIPFERVVGQLPPGAFRVPLAQVGARLEEAHVLLVARDLVVPQLAEGAVLIPWEIVAAQFPAAVLAVAPSEVKSRIENGQLVLPLDEIVRQLPPEVFGAAMHRGPVHVPGIEGFPAPFKPHGEPESPGAPEPAIAPVVSQSQPEAEVPGAVAEPVSVTAVPVAAPEPVKAPEPVRIAEPIQPPRPLPELIPSPEPVPAARIVIPEPVAVPEPVASPPQPVPVAPLFDARALERPSVPEPPGRPTERRSDAERLAPLLVRLGTATVDEVHVGDRTIISVSTAGMPGSAVASAAGRLSHHIGQGGALAPIEQATFRGAGGMLVLTPVGSGWSSGAILAIGTRSGGALARLEMLARRAARDHEAGGADGPVQAAAPPARLDAVDTPPSMAAIATELTTFGPLAAQSYREAASGAVVHCLVAPSQPAAELASFAWNLAQAMMQSSPADAFGAFHSAVLRAGSTRVEVRRLSSRAGLALVLAVGGIDTGRPGLGRLQIERAAARLGAA